MYNILTKFIDFYDLYFNKNYEKKYIKNFLEKIFECVNVSPFMSPPAALGGQAPQLV